MGQYYNIVFGVRDPETGKLNVLVNCRKVEGCGYIMAKLMEHSYIGNKLTSAVADYIWNNGPVRIMWVGDYAEEDELSRITGGQVDYRQVWLEKEGDFILPAKDFQYENKFLVNRFRREYVSYSSYFENNGSKLGDLTIDPLPLLTVVGNGRGFGDYRESDKEGALCGTWAWDELSITDIRPPCTYKELQLCKSPAV